MVFLVAACGLLAATWFAYHPGLSGGFLFDDLANLPALGKFGAVDNWPAFWRYITSGFADPTGRPLALLSFLLDARNWPAEPYAFKRTNVLLHLVNGALLCGLLLSLGRIANKPQRQYALAALLGSGMWLLHPLWISTTLYVVQREAMLPATFILLGLLGYLHGRERIATRPERGAIWILGSLGSCTLLAFLSKANGLLLPVFVLVLEFAYLRMLPSRAGVPKRLNVCLAISVYPVAAAILAYLMYRGYAGLTHAPAYRPWTEAQRLLSEPRVLMEYLRLLLLPRPYSRGLFNDDIVASTSPFQPWTTLPAILAVLGLIVFAVRTRRRHPALALAILFYFAGQSMESTTIPLELYFEHRNYVPALLLFWPLAQWLTDAGILARFRPLIATTILLLLGTETFMAAKLWGAPDLQIQIWAAQNPDSPRAQAYAANTERFANRYAQAEARLRLALKAHPDEISLAINLLGVRCESGSVAPEDLAAVEFALRNGSNRGPLTIDWLTQAISMLQNKSCPGLTAAVIQRMIDASWQNRQVKDSPKLRQDLLDLEGQLALAGGDTAAAERKFLAAIEVLPKADIALKQAAILGANGLPNAGLAQLDYYRTLSPQESPWSIRNMETLHQWLLAHDGYWESEIAHLRKTLQGDLAGRNSATATDNQSHNL